jgi:hypothetical protein
LNARVIAVAGLALSCAGYTIAAAGHAAWVTVLGLSVAALGIGATFVTAFTAALSDAPPAEAGVRSALVVADAAGFTHAFALGAVAAGAAVLIAAGLVPTVLRKPTPGAPAH